MTNDWVPNTLSNLHCITIRKLDFLLPIATHVYPTVNKFLGHILMLFNLRRYGSRTSSDTMLDKRRGRIAHRVSQGCRRALFFSPRLLSVGLDFLRPCNERSFRAVVLAKYYGTSVVWTFKLQASISRTTLVGSALRRDENFDWKSP